MQKICQKCGGKGKAKVPGMEDMFITCPACGGTGNEVENKHNIVLSEDEEPGFSNAQTVQDTFKNITNNINNENIQIQKMSKDEEVILLKQIIKYPSLFTTGIEFLYKDENSEIFIYLKHNQLFNIIQTDKSMKIDLKKEFKNKFAERAILFLTTKKK